MEGKDDVFQCRVCWQHIQGESVILPCSHKYCRPCVDRMYSHGILTCPMCRREFEKNLTWYQRFRVVRGFLLYRVPWKELFQVLIASVLVVLSTKLSLMGANKEATRQLCDDLYKPVCVNTKHAFRDMEQQLAALQQEVKALQTGLRRQGGADRSTLSYTKASSREICPWPNDLENKVA